VLRAAEKRLAGAKVLARVSRGEQQAGDEFRVAKVRLDVGDSHEDAFQTDATGCAGVGVVACLTLFPPLNSTATHRRATAGEPPMNSGAEKRRADLLVNERKMLALADITAYGINPNLRTNLPLREACR
jgi:hypothetical protein